MKIVLSSEEKRELEVRHLKEKNRRNADRIKSVLLRDEGWSLSKIAQALRLHNDTVANSIMEYSRSDRLEFNYKGSKEQLDKAQCAELIRHLEANLYTKVLEIVAYVQSKFSVSYSISGMTAWLRKHGFSYKSPKGTPSKADVHKQREFVEIYEQLKAFSDENDEAVLFVDGVHPSMQTKVSYGWIRKGQDKEVPTTASRTRMNILGAINLDDMSTVIQECEKSITGSAIIRFLDAVRANYSDNKVVHLILDQAGYNKAFEVREHASRLGIHMHYLPPYSPNLNAIERLWKVMNERVRNNVYFKTASEFRSAIWRFFDEDLPYILPDLRSRINDKFHIKKAEN